MIKWTIDIVWKSWKISDFSITGLIEKKEEGQALSKEEIKNFVRFVTEVERNTDAGDAAGIQIQEKDIVKMLEAIHKKHLNDDETTYLTKAMKKSGLVLKWPEKWKGSLVDKHSTGGVGDKTSLVLTPVLAACNLKVPMISGRRLAHTGGTLDKLESIPGFKVEQTHEQMKHILEKVGCCIVSQTKDIVPADKILYRLRDKSETVDENGLITGSIISKKAAESVDALVLDVKYGKGAFCKTIEHAKDLALKMVKAGKGNGIRTTALLTDMNSPLGYQIGNALEVAEAIQCLHGNGPDDLTVLVKKLGAKLLLSVGKVKCLDEAEALIGTKLQDGSALAKFKAMIIEQGVNKEMADALCGKENYEYNKILKIMGKKSKHKDDLTATTTGCVIGIDALLCGEVANDLGAADEHEVGLTLAVRVGDRIEKGSKLVTVHYNKELRTEVKKKLENAIDITPDEKECVTLYSRETGDF